MGKYRKCKDVRVDLLKLSGILPKGAFVKDGKITSGWTHRTTFADAQPNLVAMKLSQVGNCVIAGTSNGEVLIGSANDGTELTTRYTDGGSEPFIFEANSTAPQVVIVSGDRLTSVSATDTIHYDFDGGLSCGVMKNGRLFGASSADGYTLKWSGLGGMNDWLEINSDAGRLTLEAFGGRILNVFDFEDELIIFRECAIVRFAVGGNPENFRVKEVIGVPQVTKNAQVIAGDAILFFTDAGLMRYTGGKVTRIEGMVTEDTGTVISMLAYHDRFVFFVGTSRSLGRNVIYVYDVLRDCCQLIDINVYFLATDNVGVIAFSTSMVYRLTYQSKSYRYAVVTPEIDFGYSKRKLLKYLETDCDDDVILYIDNGEVSTRVLSPNGRLKLNMRGKDFKFTFEGCAGAVRSAVAVAEVPE